MAHGTRPGTLGHTIRTYRPDDGPRIFYVETSETLDRIFELAEEKWPGIKLNQIRIEAEHIQTDCLGYDRYDSGDYTNYLSITATEDYKLP
jgi:hypothetical protein